MHYPADDGMAPAPGASRSSTNRPLLARRLGAAMTLAGLAIAFGLVASFLAWKLVPPQYEAQARLRVSAVPPRILLPRAETQVDFRTYQRTQLALIRSQQVLNAALRQIGDLPVVREQVDPVVWLERKIQAGFDGEILRIAMNDAEPEGLSEIVNAVKDAYFSKVVDMEQQGRRKRLEDLERISRDYQSKLEKQRETLHVLEQDVGTIDGEADRVARELAVESRRLSHHELTMLRIDRAKTRAELEVRSTLPDGEGSPRPDPDAAELARLRLKLRILDAQERRLEEQLDAIDVERQEINTKYVDLGTVRAEIQKMEEAADRVGAEAEALRVELGAPDRVQVIEHAETPRADHARQRRAATLSGGSATGVVLVVGLLGSLRRSRRVQPEPPDRES